MSHHYQINEIFYSIQGEGVRAGTANVFVRFAACNLHCSKESKMDEGSEYVAGFDCDTEFASGRAMTLSELVQAMEDVGAIAPRSCILTGGEPALQVDKELINKLSAFGWYVAIETNGTRKLPDGIDWICLSPKSAWHTLQLKRCDELKMVRHAGQELPHHIPITAKNLVVSPAFDARGLSRKNLEWCIGLVKANPDWRLSVQQHKGWAVR